MHYAIVFLVFIVISPSSTADSCDRTGMEFYGHNPELALSNVEYKHVRKKPGYRLSVGDTQFVLVKLPFMDYSTGTRYAVTYPERTMNTTSGEVVTFNLTVRDNSSEFEPCSDVAVGESQGPVHKIAAVKELQVSGKYSDEKRTLVSGWRYFSMLSFRTESIVLTLYVHLTQSPVVRCEDSKKGLETESQNGGWDCPTPVEVIDYDLTDYINWANMEPDKDLLRGLDRLVDLVYVERVD